MYFSLHIFPKVNSFLFFLNTLPIFWNIFLFDRFLIVYVITCLFIAYSKTLNCGIVNCVLGLLNYIINLFFIVYYPQCYFVFGNLKICMIVFLYTQKIFENIIFLKITGFDSHFINVHTFCGPRYRVIIPCLDSPPRTCLFLKGINF